MDDQQLFLKKLNRRTRFTQFLVWIALFFTAAGIAAGYKNWLRIHQKAKAGLAGIAEIREEIPSFAKKEQISSLQTRLKKQLSDNAEQNNQTVKELKQIELSTKYIANTVYQQIENITKHQESVIGKQLPLVQDWSLSEIRFLLQTAIDILAIKQDKKAAKTALELADKRLLKKGNTDFLPLRKQISLDIARLDQYISPDIVALSKQISTIQNQLESVSKKTEEKDAVSLTKDVKTTAKENTNNEKKSIKKWVSKTISDAIVVRKFDQPLKDEMNMEGRKALSQLLSLKLETLRIMLLQGHEKNYHAQIDAIRKLIERYYPEKTFLLYKKQLNDLNSINLNPKLPDISTSLKVFESIALENK